MSARDPIQAAANAGEPYMPFEDDYLRSHYVSLGPTKCALILLRSPNSVKSRAQALGIKSAARTARTLELDAAIRAHYAKGGAAAVIAALSYPIQRNSVGKRASKLRVSLAPAARSQVLREAQAEYQHRARTQKTAAPEKSRARYPDWSREEERSVPTNAAPKRYASV